MSDPISVGGNTPRLMSARPLDPYDEFNDPDGSANLANELAGYDRISIEEACRDPQRIDEYDKNGNPNLIIWIKNEGRWEQLDNSNGLIQRWHARLPLSPDSVCGSLVRDLLGLSEEDYAKVLAKFKHQAGFDGIYRAKKKNMEKFAVVVEMPNGMSLNSKLVTGGLGGLAGLATAGLLGYGINRKRSNDAILNLDSRAALTKITNMLDEKKEKLKKAEAYVSDHSGATGKFDKFMLNRETNRKNALTAEIAELERVHSLQLQRRLDEINKYVVEFKVSTDEVKKQQVRDDVLRTARRLNTLVKERVADKENFKHQIELDALVRQLAMFQGIKISKPLGDGKEYATTFPIIAQLGFYDNPNYDAEAAALSLDKGSTLEKDDLLKLIEETIDTGLSKATPGLFAE
jgi:hypothetical protein